MEGFVWEEEYLVRGKRLVFECVDLGEKEGKGQEKEEEEGKIKDKEEKEESGKS